MKNCAICDAEFYGTHSLNRHIRRIHDTDKRCKVCDESFVPKTREICCSKECQKEQEKRNRKQPHRREAARKRSRRHRLKNRHIRNKYDDYQAVTLECIVCHKEYIGHFCSKICGEECRRVRNNEQKREAAALLRVEVFRECKGCNESFNARHHNQYYCDKECQMRARKASMKRPTHITRDCDICSNSFEAYVGIGKRPAYCSSICASKASFRQWKDRNPIQSLDCKNCGKTFMPNSRSSIIKYCSNKCLKQHWVDSSPMVRLSARFQLGIRDVITGRNKTSNVWEYLSFTPDELMSQFESQFTDGMSWDNMAEWHIDHIRPISSFDFDSTDHPDFKKCWALNNLQPLWAKDNMSKGAKWDGVVNA